MKVLSPVTVGAENLSVRVLGKRGGDVKILKSISFLAEPTEMYAIMGPSGSGKTTMLNALANRLQKTTEVTGKIYFNGHTDQMKNAHSFCGYVMQEDAFIESLTVEETITFSAKLYLRHTSKKEIKERVEAVIATMGLESCRHVHVGGSQVKGISGGQQKRVSIAIALLSNPSVLFLDEPTSGLDASLAYDVIYALNYLARECGCTVICTIHQPRSQVFSLFDRLLLLREGEVVYNGPANRAVEYFGSIGLECPEGFNPPDFFLDMLAPEDSEPTIAVHDPESHHALEPYRIHIDPNLAAELAELFSKSKLAEIQADRREEIFGLKQPLPVELRTSRRSYLKSQIQAVRILAYRELLNELRNPMNIFSSMMVVVILAALVIFLWWQQEQPTMFGSEEDPCDSTTLHNWQGAYLQIINGVMFTGFEGSFRVIRRRVLVNRESNAGAYKRPIAVWAYYLADGLTHYLSNILQILMIYWAIGGNGRFRDFIVTTFLILFAKYAMWGYVTFVGSVSAVFEVAGAAMPVGAVLFLLTAGYFMSDDQLPSGIMWISYISPARYAFHGVIATQLDNPAYLETCVGITPIKTGYYFLSLLGIGLGWRILSTICQQYFLTHIGLQS